LSALLLATVFALILPERNNRKHIKVADSKSDTASLSPIRPERRSVRMILSVVVFIPVLLGFVIAVALLIYWASLSLDHVVWPEFFNISLQGFSIALIGAFFVVLLALFLFYFSKWSSLAFVRNVAKLGIMGYAIPGAVIAVGFLIPALALDKSVIKIAKSLFGKNIGLIWTGSFIALIYAYCVRFVAVAYNPIESVSQKVGQSIPDSSKMLGAGNFRTFYRIEYPLIRTGIFSAFILVFIDILKELPLTLLLKPFRVNTLAVKAFEY